VEQRTFLRCTVAAHVRPEVGSPPALVSPAITQVDPSQQPGITHPIAASNFAVYTLNVPYDFRWTGWNVAKVEGHGLSPDEVEHVVNSASRPFPKPLGNEKWLVVGPTLGGRMIQAIYLVDVDDRLFVIHARPLTPKERRRRRRST